MPIDLAMPLSTSGLVWTGVFFLGGWAVLRIGWNNELRAMLLGAVLGLCVTVLVGLLAGQVFFWLLAFASQGAAAQAG